jgi:hypothetical protein
MAVALGGDCQPKDSEIREALPAEIWEELPSNEQKRVIQLLAQLVYRAAVAREETLPESPD